MAFRLCTKQSAGGKSQEDKQLQLSQLDHFYTLTNKKVPLIIIFLSRLLQKQVP